MQQYIRKFYLTTLIVIGATILFLPFSTFARAVGTITLKDGTIYEAVTYTVNKYHKTIEFKLDEDKKAVSFTDIESIVNEDGKDITPAIIGGYYKPGEGETWKSEIAEEHKEARRKLWNIGISLGGNLCFPLGDYYEGLGAGPGVDGDITIALTNNLALKASVSYAGMNPDDDLAYLVTNDYVDFYLLDNYSFSSWRYYLSAQYYQSPKPLTPGKVIYYLYSGLGAITDKSSADQTYLADDPAEEFTVRIEDSQTHFGTVFGGGLNYLIESQLGIHIEARMNVVWLSKSGQSGGEFVYYNDGYAYQFDLKAGLTVLLK